MTKLTAWEWIDLTGAQILDPDGWRHDDGVTMDTPITGEDFMNRLGECTVNALGDYQRIRRVVRKYA